MRGDRLACRRAIAVATDGAGAPGVASRANVVGVPYIRSMIAAIPWPPPMHIVMRP